MTEIDPLILAMNEWEVHSLRGLVTAVVIAVQAHARDHPGDKDALALAQRVKRFKQIQYDAQLAEMQAAVVRDVLDIGRR